MKRLFGHRPKAKQPSVSIDSPPLPTPLYQKLAKHGTNVQTIPLQSQPQTRQPTEDDHTTSSINHPSPTPSFGSLPPGSSPSIPASAQPRSGSPTSLAPTTTTNTSTTTRTLRQQDRDGRKKNPSTAPVALSILRALDPPRSETKNTSIRSHSEERITVSESGHSFRDREKEAVEKKEKRSFWPGRDKEREKDRDRDRGREREIILQKDKDRAPEKGPDRLVDRERERGRDIWKEDESTAKLTHMIGYLTATAAEDWTLLMDVCERASASESNAKTAVRALRHEFKYGTPPAQLSAARLWAIMLRNSSEIFITQSTSRKFLDALEELLTSTRTSPVVRERLLEVLAAAAYASGSKKDSRHEKDGFKGLWKRVKPFDKPDEGIPFDTDDAMFQPPTNQGPGYDTPIISYQGPDSLPFDSVPITPVRPNMKRISPVRNRIIPPDEDIRRLFDECTIGQGNAELLSEALAHCKPEDLKNAVIKEFHDKCLSSQELICAQIPWASAGAERSRAMKDKSDIARNRIDSNEFEDGRLSVQQTVEERLLGALLMTNAELMEALKQYDDLERVAIERKTEARSRKEVRMEHKHRNIENLALSELSNSRPSTPRSRPHTPQYHNPAQPHSQQSRLSLSETDNDPVFLSLNLAPPPAAPQGPRSISLHTRTPSPTQGLDLYVNGHDDVNEDIQTPSLNGFAHDCSPAQPSAKALGKRRVVEPDNSSDSPDDVDVMYFNKENAFSSGDTDPEFEDENDAGWPHSTVHFVYDAVAERTRQRLEGRKELVDNRVH